MARVALSFSAFVVAPMSSFAASRTPPTALMNFASWTSFAPGITMLRAAAMIEPAHLTIVQTLGSATTG